MKRRNRVFLLWLFALWMFGWVCWERGWAWLPGTSQPEAVGGFSVDTADRLDVLSFYHVVYMASEGAYGRMNWTGNVAAGIAGDTALVFKNDVVRRVNFFRALVGLPASITMNLTASAKAQQAAL
ncbi:MAG: hypothetical protein NZL93_01140, partial [Chthoniobacterales bacterium]|nr:hypothetical protein [Chthoniobacterales bacterium]